MCASLYQVCLDANNSPYKQYLNVCRFSVYVKRCHVHFGFASSRKMVHFATLFADLVISRALSWYVVVSAFATSPCLSTASPRGLVFFFFFYCKFACFQTKMGPLLCNTVHPVNAAIALACYSRGLCLNGQVRDGQQFFTKP